MSSDIVCVCGLRVSIKKETHVSSVMCVHGVYVCMHIHAYAGEYQAGNPSIFWHCVRVCMCVCVWVWVSIKRNTHLSSDTVCTCTCTRACACICVCVYGWISRGKPICLLTLCVYVCVRMCVCGLRGLTWVQIKESVHMSMGEQLLKSLQRGGWVTRQASQEPFSGE